MKRSWIGFVLLIFLLWASILSSGMMVRMHIPVEEKLQLAAQCAMEENWKMAGSFFREAEKDWKRQEHIRSCFSDHTPTEQIDADFEMLKVCCASCEPVSFAGGCRSLARQVAAVGEAHEVVWWNLL